MTQLGWKIVYEGTYNPPGEPSGGRSSRRCATSGVKGLVWVGEPTNLAKLLSEAASLGIKFDWILHRREPLRPAAHDRSATRPTARTCAPRSTRSSTGGRRREPGDAAVPRPHRRSTTRTARSRTSALRACRPGCCSPRPRTSAAPTSPATACGTRPRRSRVDRRRAARAAEPEDRRRVELLRAAEGRGRQVRARRRHQAERRHLQLRRRERRQADGRLRRPAPSVRTRRTPPIRSRPTVRERARARPPGRARRREGAG